MWLEKPCLHVFSGSRLPVFDSGACLGAADEMCELGSEKFGAAIGRFTYDPPMKRRSKIQVVLRSAIHELPAVRLRITFCSRTLTDSVG